MTMAGITKYAEGTKRITYREYGASRSIYLGKVSLKRAEHVRHRIVELIECRSLGMPIGGSLVEWVRDIDDDLHAKLADKGLVEPREDRCEYTLRELTDEWLDRADVKPATLDAYRRTCDLLIEHLGAETLAEAITARDAEGFRRMLVDSGFARASISKHVKIARRLYHAGNRWGLVEGNPFQNVVAGPQTNSENQRFHPIAPPLPASWRRLQTLPGVC